MRTGGVQRQGHMTVCVGFERGFRAIQRDGRVLHRQGEGIVIRIIARRRQGQGDFGARFGAHGVHIKESVCIRPAGQVGVNKRVDIVAVFHRVREAPRRRVVDIVAVAATVGGAPQLGHAQTVGRVFRSVSGCCTARIAGFVRRDQRIVDGQGVVAVRIGHGDRLLRHGQFAVFVGDGYIYAGFRRRILGNGCQAARAEHHQQRRSDGYDFFHLNILLSFYSNQAHA
jgi:hypothetical protein